MCLAVPVYRFVCAGGHNDYHQLSGVEVLGKVRPSTTRESTPLQVMDKAGMERLGVQDLSEAVKRFSGVTVQDYGGIGGLKTCFRPQPRRQTYGCQLRRGDSHGRTEWPSGYQPLLLGQCRYDLPIDRPG